MNTERSLKEINDNPYHVIDSPEKYKAISGIYEEDFRSSVASMILVIENFETGEQHKLQFLNVSLNKPVFTAIRDATSLYFLDTSYLKWGQNQRIEVGDFDGGPPLFWAEEVCNVEKNS
jgi:hypothetical protein